MGTTNYEDETTSSLPHVRMFKAFILDGDNLIPKIFSQAIQSVEILEGNGGPGTIKLITFGDALQYDSAKHRIDAIDEAAYSYSYTLIEGDVLGDELESVSNTFKIEASSDGGSICKSSSTFHTKGNIEIPVEKIKDAKERVKRMFRAVESYLLSNPDA